MQPASPVTDRRLPAIGPLIRQRRKARGLTLRALCDRAGVSPGYLSQVETGKAVPTLGTLAQVAQALEVGLDYFVAEQRPVDAVSRASGRERFSIPGSALAYEAVSADYPGSEMTSYVIHVPPGYASETSAHEGEELVFVLDGTIEQFLGGERIPLRKGDCLHYAGTVPHAWSNPGQQAARLLWTGTLAFLHPGRPGTEAPDPKATGETI